MYNRLKAEMKYASITQEKLGKLIDMSLPTLNKKIRGESDFTIRQAKAIKQAIGSELFLDDLFLEE